jgi:DNA-binding GntR family transcriptional regulator
MYLRTTGTHRLYEAALATEFGVSKTHVREALSVFAQPWDRIAR